MKLRCGEVSSAVLSPKAKAESPIVVRPSGSSIRSSDVQPENAESPIVVKPAGKFKSLSSRDVQPENADLPIVVRPSGSSIRAKMW